MGCGASNSNSGSVANAQSRPPVVAHTSSRPSGAPLVSRPLTVCPPFRHGAPISQGELNNQRVEFWSTRTDGNVTMWQSIRSAAEALLDGDTALANAILEATNIISPSGTLEVVYDERGHQYKVPQYCYSVPLELTSPEQVPVVAVSSKDAGAPGNNMSSNSNNPLGGPVASAGGDPIKLRIRINPGDLNVAVTSDTLSTIYQLKQQIAHDALRDLPQQVTAVQLIPERQRVMYLGKQLPDNMKIGEAKFDDTKVVQVFLRPVNAPTK